MASITIAMAARRRELLNQVRLFFRNISPGGKQFHRLICLDSSVATPRSVPKLMAVHRRKIGGFVPCQSTPN